MKQLGIPGAVRSRISRLAKVLKWKIYHFDGRVNLFDGPENEPITQIHGFENDAECWSRLTHVGKNNYQSGNWVFFGQILARIHFYTL